MRRIWLVLLAAFAPLFLVLSFARPARSGEHAVPAASPASGSASADPHPEPSVKETKDKEGPEKVKIGLYLTGLHKFDLATGGYSVEFYISTRCGEHVKDCKTNFDFLNGKATSIEKVVDHGSAKAYKVKADLADEIDLAEYPFDSHTLSIDLAEKSADVNEVEYEVDKSELGIDKRVKLAGWDIGELTTSVEEVQYEAVDEKFSNFMADVHISRPKLSSVIKLMPVFFILCAALFSLLLGAKTLPPRLAMGTGGLTAAVMFHIQLANQIPAVGYLTRADKIMIATYLILLMNLVSTVAMMILDEKKREAAVQKVFAVSRLLVPALAVATYAVVLLKVV